GLKLDHLPGPLFVLRLDAARRRVVVGPQSALGRDLVQLGECHWLAEPGEGRRTEVKLRSAQPALPGRLTPTAEGWAVRLDSPQRAVAPGQAAVCYDGTRVLGGGFIKRADLVAA